MSDDTDMALELFDALEDAVNDLAERDGSREWLKEYDEVLERHRWRYEQIKQKTIGQALAYWGAAMKQFVYGCVAPSGRVDCHGAYINIGGPYDVCSFCKRPLTEKPRERARLKEKG
jgi:hypothetical protein